jgi:hypothetical protein
MKTADQRSNTAWQAQLETIGSELFLRYRKRLMEPGISLEIRRDYPGLSLFDLFVRVHAGRRLIQNGDDFRALYALRSGQWQQILRARTNPPAIDHGGSDRISQLLVVLGGLMFAGFCSLSLLG